MFCSKEKRGDTSAKKKNYEKKKINEKKERKTKKVVVTVTASGRHAGGQGDATHVAGIARSTVR